MVFSIPPPLGTIANSEILSSLGLTSSARSFETPSKCPAPKTASTFPSPLISEIFRAMNSSLSSIRTSPAPGDTSRNSSISEVSKSLSASISSNSNSSSVSSSASRAHISPAFSLKRMFFHALRSVVWMSLSTNLTSRSYSRAASTAASNSAPGCWPSSKPSFLCSAANRDCSNTIGALPSLITFRRPSLSNLLS